MSPVVELALMDPVTGKPLGSWPLAIEDGKLLGMPIEAEILMRVDDILHGRLVPE